MPKAQETEPIISSDFETVRILEQFLFPADINVIACVDERPDHIDTINGVEIPGATYGIIDAIKWVTGCSEQEAWERAHNAGVPLGAHTDEHHGVKGCGYGKLVETEPETVKAPEAIPVVERFKRIQKAGGHTPVLFGDHAPTHATINYRQGFSIDPDQALTTNVGIFNYDYWAAVQFGTQLGLDPVGFADHIKDVYIGTVIRLTNGAIRTFYAIK